MTEPSAGLKTSKVLCEAAGTHFPAIRFCFGFVSHFETAELIAGPDSFLGAWPFPLTRREDLRARLLMREEEVRVFMI